MQWRKDPFEYLSGSIVGGIRLGMFTASFFSLQNFLAETRGVHDVFNVVGAGSATAAVLVLISTDTYHTLCILLLDIWLIRFKMITFRVLTYHYLQSNVAVPGSLAWCARNVMLGQFLELQSASLLVITLHLALTFLTSCYRKREGARERDQGSIEIGLKLSETRICLTGWLQLKLMEKANKGNEEDPSHHGEVTSGVGAAIERLEQQLKK